MDVHDQETHQGTTLAAEVAASHWNNEDRNAPISADHSDKSSAK